MKKKIVATIEARMTSSRLPGKVLMEYEGITNLEHIIRRLRRSKVVDEVVVATTINETDDPIIELCNNINCKFYRGSEEDVLLRVLEAAKSVNATHIVEVTGDCPIVDWRIIDRIHDVFFTGDYDYVANVIERTYPRGLDIQIFPVAVLDRVNELTKSPVDHEHVSLYIYTHPEIFRIKNVAAEPEIHFPEYEITLDTPEDYRLISDIYRRLYPLNNDFDSEMVMNLIRSDEELHERALAKERKDPFKEQREWLEENEKI